MHEHLATDVVSIGPYVLAGGELAAMVVCDAVMRKLPGALGHEESALEESFSEALEGAPEYPHYTRPFDWRGHTVPEILLSGDHATGARVAAGAQRERGSAPRLSARLLRYHSASARGTAPGRSRLSLMSGVIDSIERAQLRRVPVFQAGDRVRVHFQVVEGTRRRTQVFEGIVIKRQGSGARETFTVRKQSFGVGVERTFPLHSPKIEQIEVAARGDVRRAKLYYLRDRVGRGARVRERRWTGPRGAGLRRGRDAGRRRTAARRGGARRGDGGRGGCCSRRRGARRPPSEAAAAEAPALRQRPRRPPAAEASGRGRPPPRTAEEPAAEQRRRRAAPRAPPTRPRPPTTATPS